MIYGTRGVVEWLIKHEAKLSALSDTRPQPECHKSRKARLAYIKWFKVLCRSTQGVYLVALARTNQASAA